MKVRYHAHHLELSGYGKAAAGNIEALRRVGVEVEVLPVDTRSAYSQEVDVAIYHTTPHRLATIVPPPEKRMFAKKHVAFTTWETDPMPEHHQETLDTFDAVIMPSEFCVNMAQRIGFKNTFIVPHGFDPVAWPVGEKSLDDDIYTFYSIGAWGERKNMLGVLKAYLHAFTKEDCTRLVMIIDKVDFQAIHSVIARSMIPKEELPGLLIPDGRLSDAEILKLHQESDCFVTATRGEGFGLPIFEAAVMGNPVISPGFGAQTEFLFFKKEHMEVPFSMTPVFPGENEISVSGNQMVLKTTLANGSDCKQMWAEPDLVDLAVAMRIRRFGTRYSNDLRKHYEENYSFDAIGKKFLQALNQILES